MIESKKIIIATESYVANQGFHLIFNKLRNSQVVDKVESMPKLYEAIKRDEVDILLISDSLIAHPYDMNNLLKQFNGKQPEIIAYVQGESKLLENQNIFSNIISHSDSKEVIIEQLNQLIEKLCGDKNDESDDLSDREKDILKEVALGLTNNEIADKLFISAHTVITHRKKITKKLGIKSVSGLTVYAIINGLIEMEEVGS